MTQTHVYSANNYVYLSRQMIIEDAEENEMKIYIDRQK